MQRQGLAAGQLDKLTDRSLIKDLRLEDSVEESTSDNSNLSSLLEDINTSPRPSSIELEELEELEQNTTKEKD